MSNNPLRPIRRSQSRSNNRPRDFLRDEFREALFRLLTTQDIEYLLAVLIDKAMAGESWALREVLDRALGRPLPGNDSLGADPPEPAKMLRLITVGADGNPLANQAPKQARPLVCTAAGHQPIVEATPHGVESEV